MSKPEIFPFYRYIRQIYLIGTILANITVIAIPGLFMRKGFTLIEIMIVLGIFSLIITLAVPGFIRARRVTQARACQANLQRIDGAIEQWIMDNNARRADATVEALMHSTIGDDEQAYLTGEWPKCPATDDSYEITEGDMVCPSGLVGHRIEDAILPVSEWALPEE